MSARQQLGVEEEEHVILHSPMVKAQYFALGII